MDFPPRGRSFGKSSNVSSPDPEDDEESRGRMSERHPTLSRNVSHRQSSSVPPDVSPSSYGFGGGEVIVKIEGSLSNKNTDTTTAISSTSEDTSSVREATPEEFSFRRPDHAADIINEDPDRVETAPDKTGQGGLPPLRGKTNIRSPVRNTNASNSLDFDGSSREIRVSFQESNLESKHPVGSDSSSAEEEEEENNLEDDRGNTSSRSQANVASLGGMRTISTSKVRSRLTDPAPSTPKEHRSGNIHKSGYLKDDEEDDPFEDADIPDELKRVHISTFVVIEWVGLVAILGALICTLIIPALKSVFFWKMDLWKWEVLILVLISGRLVSGWVIRILVFFIERNFLLRKRVLYFVYGIRQSVQAVLWFGLVLITWFSLFDKRLEREAHTEPLRVISRILVIGEVCALLWLLKTLVVKVLASSFHVNAFFERIQETVFNQYVIETLSGPPSFELHLDEDVQRLENAGIILPPELRATVLSPTRNSPRIGATHEIGHTNEITMRSPIGFSRDSGHIHKKHHGGEDHHYHHHHEGITIDDLQKMNQKNISAWNMKRLMKMVRKGALMTTIDEQVEGTAELDEHANEIRSEVEAKAAAKKIFRNVAKPQSRYICLADLKRFMAEDDAIKTMVFFDGVHETKRISKKALKDWVVKVFRERRALSLTLSDTKTAVNKLHQIVNVLVAVIIVIVLSTTLNIITSESIVFLSSQLVLAAFVFGNTCKNVFESIIFLFVIHPFDVGDRCEIDGVQMVVEEMNILSTIFLRYDNLKIIFPNYVLLSKSINNFFRSPDMGDGIEFSCPLATPPEKIALMREKIMSYIVHKKEHWYPDAMVILKDVNSLHTLTMAIWLQHKMNHQDMGLRWERRGLLVEECIKLFRELDIEYRFHPVNVNVR